MLACRVFGHRYRFSADGAVMRWDCQRGCGAGGSKSYPSAAAARRYSMSLDSDSHDEIGRRAPLVGLFPLRMWHRLRHRSRPE